MSDRSTRHRSARGSDRLGSREWFIDLDDDHYVFITYQNNEYLWTVINFSGEELLRGKNRSLDMAEAASFARFDDYMAGRTGSSARRRAEVVARRRQARTITASVQDDLKTLNEMYDSLNEMHQKYQYEDPELSKWAVRARYEISQAIDRFEDAVGG